MSEPLELNSNLVFQLFGDPEFYTANPCFLALEETGKAAYEKYREMVEKKLQKCPGCSQNMVVATLGNFAKVLKRLHEVAPEEIERLMRYLERRMGYRPDHLILYYKDRQNQMQELRCGYREQGGSHVGQIHSAGALAAGACDVAQ